MYILCELINKNSFIRKKNLTNASIRSNKIDASRTDYETYSNIIRLLLRNLIIYTIKAKKKKNTNNNPIFSSYRSQTIKHSSSFVKPVYNLHIFKLTT